MLPPRPPDGLVKTAAEGVTPTPDDNHTPGTEAVQLPGWYSLSVWPVNWDL